MTDTLRPELERPMPRMISTLPVFRGYPVPWFVDHYPDGTPEFRAMDPAKWRLAVSLQEPRCWTCGGPLKSRSGYLDTFAFLIGPMCAINRVSAEPPSHVECAEWSARNCPFLSRPQARRREDEFINVEKGKDAVAGHMIPRNPGVSLVWPCARYTIFNDGKGKPLIEVGDLIWSPTWWAEGRPATRAEIVASIDSGLPLLEATTASEADPEAARRELGRRRDWVFERLLPAA
jgi:hypothetical protein